MKNTKPKTVHSVHVNLLFRGGLDTARYARELAALHAAAAALRRVALEQAVPEVGGQNCNLEEGTCEFVLGGPDPTAGGGTEWCTGTDANGEPVLWSGMP